MMKGFSPGWYSTQFDTPKCNSLLTRCFMTILMWIGRLFSLASFEPNGTSARPEACRLFISALRSLLVSFC